MFYSPVEDLLAECFFFFFPLVSCLFRATPTAYGDF